MMTDWSKVQIEWRRCPVKFIQGLKNYVEAGIIPGGFLAAVLANDLKHAVMRADPESVGLLVPLLGFMQWQLPEDIWGSYEAVNQYSAKAKEANEKRSKVQHP